MSPQRRPPRLGQFIVLFALLLALGVTFVVIHVAIGDGGDGGTHRSHRARPQMTKHAPSKPRGRGSQRTRRSADTAVRWRRSRALGIPSAGALVRGVRLPAGGRHFATWDPVLRRSPNRPWRRHGTDALVRVVLDVVRSYSAAHPRALPALVGDLSRPRGGDFGRRFGIIGHSTHQNGLDVDIYYPRLDRRPRPPTVPSQVDRALAQDLVDRFVRAGAALVLVGPNVRLTGPASVVKPFPNHDNHLHARIPNPDRRT